MTMKQPLDKEHLALIDQQMLKLGELGELHRKMMDSGLDVGNLESERQYLVEKYNAIKRNFFKPYAGSKPDAQ